MAFAIPTPEWLSFPNAVVMLVATGLDASEVRAAILSGAEDGRLMVRGVSVLFGPGWRRFSDPDHPLWTHGIFFVEDRKVEPEIWRASLIGLFTARKAEVAAKHSGDGAPRPARGRPPRERLRIVAEMQKMDRSRLAAMKGVEMETTFKANRETCEKAREEVLSVITDR